MKNPSLYAFLLLAVVSFFTASGAQALESQNCVGNFFSGTLDCAEVDDPASRNLYRENDRYHYEATSGYLVATNKEGIQKGQAYFLLVLYTFFKHRGKFLGTG